MFYKDLIAAPRLVAIWLYFAPPAGLVSVKLMAAEA